MGKYERFRGFLQSLDSESQRLSFAEIERILGFKLPKSARSYPAWWSNDDTGHSHARAWLEAGWRTGDVDMAARKVTLTRSGDGQVRTKQDPWGCMAGTVHIAPGADLTAPTGDTWNANGERPSLE